MQTAVIASVAALSWVGGVSAASLGVLAARPWWVGASLGGGFISYFMYVGLRQRQNAQKLRERMRSRGGNLLLPDAMRELSWFTIMCGLSGIGEECLYRGFLFSYIPLYLPHINGPGLVILTSLVFGIGHAYQGWRGIVSTTVSGLIFGTLYVSSGSLLLPALVHSAGNLQAVLILWPRGGTEMAWYRAG
jgi:CAAX protease family protein